jgi:hypothetical protein
VPPPQLTKKAAMRGIAVLGHEHLFIWSTAAPAAHPNFFFALDPSVPTTVIFFITGLFCLAVFVDVCARGIALRCIFLCADPPTEDTDYGP